MKSQNGFTLIELMVTVVIISIIASVALPAYNDYVIRSRIQEATSTLSILRVQMEQFFQDHLTYDGGSCAPATQGKYFTFDCSVAPSAIGFELHATGKDSMDGFSYTIDHDSLMQSDVSSPAPDDWRHATVPCWITKKGGQC